MTAGRRLALELLAAIVAAALAIWLLPQVLELFALINATVYVALAVLALSLALIWGFGGILCFGQTAFFGLGGYAYAVAAINLGDSTPGGAHRAAGADAGGGGARLLHVLWPDQRRLHGRDHAHGDADPVQAGQLDRRATNGRIGRAPLGGFNGIPATPPLNWPGDPGRALTPEQIFAVAVACLAGCYVAARLVLRRTSAGSWWRSARTSCARSCSATTCGCYKLGIFTLGGADRGLAGMLFANCVFVSPTMFGLAYAAQVIIWVIVGGLGTLVGPAAAAILLQMLTSLGRHAAGLRRQPPARAILIVTVLALPRGLQPTAQALLGETAAMTSLLAIERLTMRFGGVVAVDDVSLAVGERELRCLIGPNGAGKSTLLQVPDRSAPAERRPRALARPRRHRAGGLAHRPARHRHQDPGAVSVRRAHRARRRELAVRGQGEAGARRVAGAVLERLGIGGLAERMVGLLAHGQRQLVELAMVVAPQPELIILDEPTAGMTAKETQRTAELIQELNRDHAIVVVEHDMPFVRRIAGSVTVLHQGRVLIEGDVAQVLADPVVHDVYLGRAAS